MFFDPLYLLFAIPGLIIGGLASLYTHSMFSEFSRIRASSGMTGAEAAETMLHRAGIYDVKIERVEGFLSDHYDPSEQTLPLAAIGVACHEAGHALQHAAQYGPLGLRSALVPLCNISSTLSYIVVLAGFLFQSGPMVMFGALLFSAVVIFSIVTLPVEWDASSRAKQLMVTAGIVSPGERVQAGKVLNAAFLTYVAAVVSSLLTLLYYVLRAAGMNRD